MAWNQPGNSNNNPWGKKPSPGGGDLDQAFKDWQKRIESLFGGGGGGGSSTPLLIILAFIIAGWMFTGFYQVKTGTQGVVQRFGRHVETVGDGWNWRLPWPIETVTKVGGRPAADEAGHNIPGVLGTHDNVTCEFGNIVHDQNGDGGG